MLLILRAVVIQACVIILMSTTCWAHYYQMEFVSENISHSDEIWMPIPMVWDGSGQEQIKSLRITPEPFSVYADSNSGTMVAYWRNARNHPRYSISFILKSSDIFHDISDDIIWPEYDRDSFLYLTNTASNHWVQSDHPEIVDLANSIAGHVDNPYYKAKLVYNWVSSQNWNFTGAGENQDALSALRTKETDCAGISNVFVALCRALGIPARNVAGFHPPPPVDQPSFPDGTYHFQGPYDVNNPPSLGAHVWVEFYLQDYGWIQSDPAWGTHPEWPLGRMPQHRVITSKGNNIVLGYGSSDIRSWYHLPNGGITRLTVTNLSSAPWESEVGLVNISSSSLAGTLRGFNSTGSQVWTRNVSLAGHGRLELDIAQAAGNAASNIESMRFDITDGQAVGYQKFFQSGKYRVGLEALPRANQESLYVPHIASDDTWWTVIGWNNTTNAAKSLQFAFDTGQQAEKQLGAGGHDSFTIASLFNNTKQPGIGAAQISNGAGMVGLVLFGGDNVLSGVSLSDATTSTLYFPHVAHNDEWWTGLVVYNPGSQKANLTLTYFDGQGTNLGNHQIDVEPGQKMVGTPDNLNFPDGTEWFMVQASQPVTGFELFGTNNQQQLAGYSVVNLATSTGVFPKLEPNGWTGIAFVNPDSSSIDIQLVARNDAGEIIAETSMTMSPGQKQVLIAENLFENQDISSATYVSFTATGDVVGFQLNSSTDRTMLDAIPALGGSHTGTQHLFFPHIAAE